MANRFFLGKEVAYDEEMMEFIQNKQQIDSCIDDDETESAKDLQEIYNLLECSVMSQKQYVATKLSQWGLSYAEISELMGTTPNAVGLLLLKARGKKEKINKLLREYIEAEEIIQNAKVKFYNRPLKSDLE